MVARDDLAPDEARPAAIAARRHPFGRPGVVVPRQLPGLGGHADMIARYGLAPDEAGPARIVEDHRNLLDARGREPVVLPCLGPRVRCYAHMVGRNGLAPDEA